MTPDVVQKGKGVELKRMLMLLFVCVPTLLRAEDNVFKPLSESTVAAVAKAMEERVR